MADTYHQRKRFKKKLAKAKKEYGHLYGSERENHRYLKMIKHTLPYEKREEGLLEKSGFFWFVYISFFVGFWLFILFLICVGGYVGFRLFMDFVIK